MRIRNIILFVVALALLSSLPAILLTNRASGAAGAPVHVVNTPLPVQGTVNAVQSGPWKVGISGAVNVASLPNMTLSSGSTVGVINSLDVNSNPVPVVTRDELDPALHAYDDSCSGSANGAFYALCVFQSVPVGKTLVVEEYDIRVLVASAQGILPLDASLIFSANHPYLPVSYVGTSGSTDRFIGHHLTRLYVPAGTAPDCDVDFNLSSNSSVDCTISGYLVDAH